MGERVASGLQLSAQRHRRFAHEQRGEQRRDHQYAEQQVGAGPGRVFVAEAGGAKPFGEEQGASGGQQCRDAVAGHVAGGEGGLAGVVGDLQAIGVDGDVLRRRGESHDNGDGDQP